jgi:ankyrin repeat protein
MLASPSRLYSQLRQGNLPRLPYVAEDVSPQKDAEYRKTLLHRVAEMGYRDFTTRCHNLGGKDLARDKCGETVLHYVAEHRHPGIVQILIQADADRTILDSHGRTVLDCARTTGPVESSYPQIVAYLQQ